MTQKKLKLKVFFASGESVDEGIIAVTKKGKELVVSRVDIGSIFNWVENIGGTVVFETPKDETLELINKFVENEKGV